MWVLGEGRPMAPDTLCGVTSGMVFMVLQPGEYCRDGKHTELECCIPGIGPEM